MHRADRARLAEQQDLVGTHTENLARHRAGGIADQVDRHRGDLVRFHFLELLHARRFFRRVGGNRIGHAAPGEGRDAVGAHVELLHVQRNGLGERRDTELGGRVVRLAEVADQPGGGGHVHIRSAMLRLEMRGGGTTDEERAMQVHVDDGAPFLLVHVVEEAVAQVARVADHAVDAAEMIERARDDIGRAVPGGHAVGAGDGRATRGADLLDQPVRDGGVAALSGQGHPHVIDDDLCTGPRQRQGNAPADSAAGAGHDDYLAFHLVCLAVHRHCRFAREPARWCLFVYVRTYSVG